MDFSTLIGIVETIQTVFIIIILILIAKILADIGVFDTNKAIFIFLFGILAFFTIFFFSSTAKALTITDTTQVQNSVNVDDEYIWIETNQHIYFENSNFSNCKFVDNDTSNSNLHCNDSVIHNNIFIKNVTNYMFNWIYLRDFTYFTNNSQDIFYTYLIQNPSLEDCYFFNNSIKFYNVYTSDNEVENFYNLSSNSYFLISESTTGWLNFKFNFTFDSIFFWCDEIAYYKNTTNANHFAPAIFFYDNANNSNYQGEIFKAYRYSVVVFRNGYYDNYFNFTLYEDYQKIDIDFVLLPTTKKITLNVFDVLGNPLDNVSVSLTKVDNTNGYFKNFDNTHIFYVLQGSYAIHISKIFFHPKYEYLNFTVNTTVNVYLEFNETLDYDKELIDYEAEQMLKVYLIIGVIFICIIGICVAIFKVGWDK